MVPKNQVRIEPSHEELYFSLFGFDNSIFEYIQLNKTVSGFSGSYFADFLYFDIDRDGDLPGSLASTRDLVRRLYNRFQLSPKQLFIAFSGSKGFHVGIHASLFGGFEPCPQLPMQLNVLAARLVAECHELSMEQLQDKEVAKKAAGQHFGDVDFGIYNANRIFRAPNSLNAKSGRYKVCLTSAELIELDLDAILALAAAPRTDYKPEARLTSQAPIQGLAAMWEYARTFDVAAFTKSKVGSKTGDTIDRDFFAPPMQGERDNTLFKQACHLFDHSDLYESHVLALVSSINQSGGNPLPDEDLRRIVRSAFKRTQSAKSKSVLSTDAAETDKVEIWTDWTDEWLDYYTQVPSPMTCLLPEIDADQEGNFKGKLAVFIGSGGTRKSYAAQNVLMCNLLGFGARGIYSSMEMGKPEVVNRLMDMGFDPENGVSASKVLQGYARQDKEGTREILRSGALAISDNLVLTNNSGKTPSDYEKDIQDTIRLYGSVDLLVIDGLSAMGGKGEETERYSRHTLELKELAKRYNLFIVLICHTTKACAAHTRDARPFVRGSEKILDNSDFSITFANIIDDIHSTPDNILYRNNLAAVKYYNKRGSGRMINQLMEFDGLKKLFAPSSAPLTSFPDYDNFCREYLKTQKQSDSRRSKSDI